MYSQYSYYQNTPPPGHHQQQQQQLQQQVATSTLGQIWNGVQWVAAPPPLSAPVVATAPPPIIKHGKTHAQLVQHYTTYYHMWNEQSNQARVSLVSLPPPHPNTPTNNERRSEMERREKWATYYASNSAALAHYHLALGGPGGVGVEPYARPTSPPVPPQMALAAGGVVDVASPVVAAPASNATAVDAGTSVGAMEATSSLAVGGIGDGGGGGGGGGGIAAATAYGIGGNASSTKKKKRWASSSDATPDSTGTPSTLLDLEREAIRRSGGVVGNDDDNHGKSTSKKSSPTKSSSTSSAAAAAAAPVPAGGETNRGGDTSLYLNKFVQEKSTPVLKRKYIDVGSSSSYYGPSLSRENNVPKDDDADDYVPLTLDRPLGYGTTAPSKKKQKKNSSTANKTNNNMSGFNANEATLSDRARRFQGQGGLDSASNAPTTIANVEKYMGKTTIGGSMKQLDENDYERMTVKGTCTVLEKQYLRLTSPPKSELVRPQRILEEHLSHLKASYYGYRERGSNDRVHNGRSRDYSWYCSQMKAIRQDLTVQRIINAFAVDVYETHAKMALEEDDINEYNQSQTQLKELYDLIDRRRQRRSNNYDNGSGLAKTKGGRGMPKKNKKVSNKCGGMKEEEDADNANDDIALINRNEFIAYRIIYYVFLSGNKKYEGGSSDIFKIMLELTPEQRQDECIHHALSVRAAVADNNYHKFFQLQDIAPNMGDYLMDKIVPSVRQGALQRICKGYRPSVPENFVLKELGFDAKNKEEVRRGMAWLKSCGCKFEGGSLLTKDTVLTESAAVGVTNSLI